jgi:hypothetical protein
MLALTPTSAELIAAASVLIVSLLLSTVIVWLAPDPTWIVKLPESVSLALTASEYSEDVCAREFTTTVWLPAIAELLADVKLSTSVFELDPCFCDITPLKSVRACRLVVKVDRSLPSDVNTVSCACSVVS